MKPGERVTPPLYLFLPLHHFYLKKFTTNDIYVHVLICRFSLKFSNLMKQHELSIKKF